MGENACTTCSCHFRRGASLGYRLPETTTAPSDPFHPSFGVHLDRQSFLGTQPVERSKSNSFSGGPRPVYIPRTPLNSERTSVDEDVLNVLVSHVNGTGHGSWTLNSTTKTSYVKSDNSRGNRGQTSPFDERILAQLPMDNTQTFNQKFPALVQLRSALNQERVALQEERSYCRDLRDEASKLATALQRELLLNPPGSIHYDFTTLSDLINDLREKWEDVQVSEAAVTKLENDVMKSEWQLKQAEEELYTQTAGEDASTGEEFLDHLFGDLDLQIQESPRDTHSPRFAPIDPNLAVRKRLQALVHDRDHLKASIESSSKRPKKSGLRKRTPSQISPAGNRPVADPLDPENDSLRRQLSDLEYEIGMLEEMMTPIPSVILPGQQFSAYDYASLIEEASSEKVLIADSKQIDKRKEDLSLVLNVSTSDGIENESIDSFLYGTPPFEIRSFGHVILRWMYKSFLTSWLEFSQFIWYVEFFSKEDNDNDNPFDGLDLSGIEAFALRTWDTCEPTLHDVGPTSVFPSATNTVTFSSVDFSHLSIVDSAESSPETLRKPDSATADPNSPLPKSTSPQSDATHVNPPRLPSSGQNSVSPDTMWSPQDDQSSSRSNISETSCHER